MRVLNPNISVDCVVFGYAESELKVLLIQRDASIANDRSLLSWSLPGDLIQDDEGLDDAAHRVLQELTTLDNVYLKQFGAFGDPARVKKPSDKIWLQKTRDYPEARVITVAYFALVNIMQFEPHPSNFAVDVQWLSFKDLSHDLAFDHEEIIQKGIEALRREIDVSPIVYNLLPPKFTLSQVQELYEVISGENYDKRNFRKKILAKDILKPLDEWQKGVSHKPAQLFELSE
ncbi:NUDIX domain-containing protein [Fulvivirga sp. RKSG066]|uniref:NUDIX hydrolase n=1 Tax=Fulvivirga aurantia TaxID=2529383 RepID=UPI0012BD386A|nr:NUDIX domain-containing protein [Fulvivirga aurantia]MTI21160.1 NUDIX domain-containing protein [Fulvivirga aurantia]